MLIYPVFIPQNGCEYNCIYCNQFAITNTANFDYEKTKLQLTQFCQKHATKTKQIAFFGGTFTNLPLPQRQYFYKLCKAFIDENTSIRISTHPNSINKIILAEAKQNGVKTIELGIQSFCNTELLSLKRNYNFYKAVKSCLLVKKHGFELGIQLMTGVLEQSADSFIKSVKTAIKLMPDFVRIYPLVVIKNTPLQKMYEQNKFIPISTEEAVEWVAQAKILLDENKVKTAKIGLHGDIDIRSIVAGPYCPRFGERVKANLLLNKIVSSFDYEKILVISSKDVSLFLGNKKQMLNCLKAKLNQKKIKVKVDIELKSNDIYYTSNLYDFKIW